MGAEEHEPELVIGDDNDEIVQRVELPIVVRVHPVGVESMSGEMPLAAGCFAVRPARARRSPLRGPDLNWSFAGRSGFLGPFRRAIKIGGFDDPKASHLFFGFGVRPVGHRYLSPRRPHDRGRLTRGAGRRRTPRRRPVADRC